MSLASLIAAALALWGILIPIRVEFFDNDIGLNAQGCGPGGLIGIYRPNWETMDDATRLSLLTHEIGHCAGLPHYGSCNWMLSIMGCWNLGEITPYDRARMGGVHGNRAVIPMVAN